MSEILCSAPLVRGSEFFLNSQGVRLFGTCGQRALASAASSVCNADVNPLGIYNSMLQHGWCDAGGASTTGGLVNQARQMNLAVAALQGYGEPWSGWYNWCKAQVSAGNPTVVETANGQALVDSISGAGENAQNLQYHYIALLGYFSGGFSQRAQRNLPEGFWAADGDSFAGNNDNAHNFNAVNVLQFYPVSVLATARLCAGIALKGRSIAPMSWMKEANGFGKDAKGHGCGPGDYNMLAQAGLLSVDGLTSEIYPDSTGHVTQDSFLALENGDIVIYHKATNTSSVSSGSPFAAQMLVAMNTLLKVSQKAPAPPPAPPPPPVIQQADPTATALVAALEAALAAHHS